MPAALDESSALSALDTACRELNLPSEGAELIRIGSNAVFRLPPPSGAIARIAASTKLLGEARKQVAVAHWLQQERYPATQALDLDQPVVAAGRVVTFWVSISEREEYAPIGDVARLIRWLHDLPAPPAGLTLPPLQPFGPDGAPFPTFHDIDPSDAEFMTERIAEARAVFPTLDYALPKGHIHGDANVGNVLRSATGEPVLIDLDSFSTGPREWDLIQTAIFADRLGWHTADEYREFVDVYGYDITKWDSYPILAEMRELAMTSWLCRMGGKSSRQLAECAKRLAALRTGSSRKDWSAY